VPAPRFFVEQALAVNTRVALPAAVARHAVTVLRLREGDPIVLFDGRGGEYRARLVGPEAGPGPRQAEVTGHDAIEREPSSRITLIQALATSDKIDWVIEKAVEIGVARVIVTAAARSTARLEPARRERRLRHWQELAIAACCQSGRNRPVSVLATASLDEALHAAVDADLKWLLDPAAPAGLPRTPTAARSVALAIGPEGGFEPGEIQRAAQAGFVPVSLGPRILRTETAGLAAAAAWLALSGEFS
jgi:16S rRNA (uracil1498-N3)-methyltransferase